MQMWFQHDRLHRDNGKPAVVFNNGTKLYFSYGVRYYPEEVEGAQ